MENKKEFPSMDEWIKEAKNAPNAVNVGMYLIHNGTVRLTPKSKVRFGSDDIRTVSGMYFSYDAQKVENAVAEAYKMDGIYYIRTWLNSGVLKVGDDLMYVLVGGDIRPHVVDALQILVEKIKTECVIENELFAG